MTRALISPSEQIKLHQERIASGIAAVEQAKMLVSSPDKDEVRRGLWMIGFNHPQTTRHAYTIGQIKWRLSLGDPSYDLEQAIKYFAVMLRDCKKFGAEINTCWAHLVAFVAVILSGSVPKWVSDMQTDLSPFIHQKKRLEPWEINLGYQSALAIALSEGELPAVWPRFLTESAGRSGLKNIHQNISTYERLFRAAQSRSWNELVSAVSEVDRNFKRRASSERSYAEVFGDGPYNQQSIDYIAAAILRKVQTEGDFPRHRIFSPHIWLWKDHSISHISPACDA